MWEKVENILSDAEADNKTIHKLKISITIKSGEKNSEMYQNVNHGFGRR